jgi:hypothetical protein
MENKNAEQQELTSDRRDPVRDGSSFSGSTKRNNDATEKALHPDENRDEHTGMTGSGVIARTPDPEGATVDQNPGETQKQNQSKDKDDPLAA